MSDILLDKKINYWENQLLDLGRRNKMINYRETKRSTLKILEPSFDELFKRIAIDEEELTFQRAVDEETDVRVYTMLSLLEKLSISLPVTVGDIKTESSVLERQRTLKNLRSKAKLSIEEQGTNVLYLSFGFVEWKHGSGAAAQLVKSPLVLVPVSLTIESMRAPYTLSRHDDDIVVNPTLDYYCKTEYGEGLPAFNPEEQTIDEYLTSLEAVADKHGWRIIREVSLGLLSFLKISMYKDLKQNEDRIRENAVIRAMAGDNAEINDIPDEVRNFNPDNETAIQCHQVMNADSSQQDAILYSKNGVSFVMQGPPGTGKSQTIANIIAEALADGKKVLFVSEKMAALQVVYRRLQDVHLADFCLPLHSSKANKKEILEQIGATLELKQTKVKESALRDLDELEIEKSELNRYATALHAEIQPLGISAYEAYSRLSEVLGAPSVQFTVDDVLGFNPSQLHTVTNILDKYSAAVKKAGNKVKDNPWYGLSGTAGLEFSNDMKLRLSELQPYVSSMSEAAQILKEKFGYNDIIYIDNIENTVRLLNFAATHPVTWLSGEISGELLSETENAKEIHNSSKTLEDAVSAVFRKEIYSFPVEEWKKETDRLFSEIKSQGVILSDSAEDIIVNKNGYTEAFSKINEYSKSIVDSVEKTNSLIGSDFSINAFGLSAVRLTLDELSKGITINSEWLKSDISRAKDLFGKGKNLTETINEKEAEILKDWERDILNIDCSAMLGRFRTEYTGLFKGFNAQYKQDRKTLLALSKKGTKLDDAEAVDILQKLKAISDDGVWFEENETALSTTFGTLYTGRKTEWSYIENALSTAEKLKEIFKNDIPEKLITMLSGGNYGGTVNDIRGLLEAAETAASDMGAVCNSYGLKLSLDELSAKAVSNISTFYTGKLDELYGKFSEILPYTVNGEVTTTEVIEASGKVPESSKLLEKINASLVRYIKLYEGMYSGYNTDWNGIISGINIADQLRTNPLGDRFIEAVSESTENKSLLIKLAEQLRTAKEDSQNAFTRVKSKFTYGESLSETDVTALNERLGACLSDMSGLGYWLDLSDARSDCFEAGLAGFINAVEADKIFDDITGSYLRAFYTTWLDNISEANPSIRKFRRNLQDMRVEKFCNLDEKQLTIAQMRIREKLISSLPTDDGLLKATDEMAILNKERNKKRNIMPLRKLFRSIPNLLMTLKPCLMMSPLSVSHFLETEAYHFDLVIFDEASQIFPEDAIGAIFRGSQVIITGDSKQMPPTSFFTATTDDGEDYDGEDEEGYTGVVADSILEEAAAVLPNRTLLWHYRSKHEHLIAFSNREIYNNNLITFPNRLDNVPDMGVEYIYVPDGVYEGGGKNCNIKEAQKCVELVKEHIEKYPNRSLGLIAFSEKQQAAIEDAIIEFRENNPQYESFFTEDTDEPFFVKNLENVQGDERDTIIFSVCYAKDIHGKMYMRFGPLGQDGGERRLNVAVTRAKCNVKLVGSIIPSDIDLNKTNAEGVRMLRAYIEFARNGITALKSEDDSRNFGNNDDFCDIVAEYLRENGYNVKQNVGCSDYKIDIGVTDPENPEDIIAGIECDGLSYSHARTARDRDHNRTDVLKRMGWNMYRVWSTEWIRTGEAEKSALLGFVKDCIENKNKKPEESNDKQEENLTEEIAEEVSRETTPVDSSNPYSFAYYPETDFSAVSHGPLAGEKQVLADNVLYVITNEQPIHTDLLYKRIGGEKCAEKVDDGVRASVNEAIGMIPSGTISIDGDGFIRLLPKAKAVPRIPREGTEPRAIEYITAEEISEMMKVIIEKSYGITPDDLSAACSKLYGFTRRNAKIKAKTEEALSILSDSGYICLVDGKITLMK